MNAPGTVHLVGAGPGDPGLVTLRGKELIERCDVIVADALVNPEILAWAGPGCEVLVLGKEPGLNSEGAQREIEEVLVDRARRGQRVVRLKGGDPLIFGRGGEEMAALAAAGIPFDVVPGVTAAFGAAAETNLALTHREHSSFLVFLTGHEDPEKAAERVDWRALAQAGGTLCIYMGMRQLPRIVAALQAGGMDAATPAVAVQWATTAARRSVHATLGGLVEAVEAAGLGSPAVIVIGKVAGLPEVRAVRPRALAGRRVVVTRGAHQAGALREKLAQAGAEVMEIPLIEVRAAPDREVLLEVLAGIAQYDWIVFTSTNGVRLFFEMFHRAFKDIRCFGGMRVAAVGAATAREVEKHFLEVELQPAEATAEALATALIATASLPNAKVLVVTGNRNRDVLVRRLETEGEAIVDTLPIYETRETDLRAMPILARFRREGADAITFTSSSAVEHYARESALFALEAGARAPLLCSLGPQTSASLRERGLRVDVEAGEHHLDSLVEALAEHFGG